MHTHRSLTSPVRSRLKDRSFWDWTGPDRTSPTLVKSKGKEGKSKGKRSGQEFYQVNIHFIIVSFIYTVDFILII